MTVGPWGPSWLGPALVTGWLAVLAALASFVKRTRPDQPEWSRKLVHIGTGPVVLIAWACGIDRTIAVPVAGVVTLLAALNHRFRLLPGIEDIDRHSYGTIAYGASITLLLGLFWPERPSPWRRLCWRWPWGMGWLGWWARSCPHPAGASSARPVPWWARW